VGIGPDSIIVYDRAFGELQAAGFEERAEHYRSSGRSDRLRRPADVFGQAGRATARSSRRGDAIINVPVLKDQTGGLSGALKNHFGSIHNPNKMHTDTAALT